MREPKRSRALAFIEANLPAVEVPGTGLHLHLAGPRSGLGRLVPPGGAPYWAHAWPGGLALALHLATQPETVQGRAVVEIGTGSGLVALAALRAGASRVLALDADPLAALAAALNARANGLDGLEVRVLPPQRLAAALSDLPTGPEAPLILAGDVFYDEAVARRIATALDAAPPGVTALVGDVGRRFLPLDRLAPLASYPVRDLGDPPSAPLREGRVFRWHPA